MSSLQGSHPRERERLPGCQHHLRFGSDAANQVEARNALQVEGRIKHPPGEEPWEYTVVVYVRNERGEEVARHVINVGALGEDRGARGEPAGGCDATAAHRAGAEAGAAAG